MSVSSARARSGPNLIYEAGRSGAKRALVNARMTQGSADGWRRVQGLFRKLVGRFDVVLAADTDTAQRLGSLLGRNVRSSGNLKSACRDRRRANSNCAAFAKDLSVAGGCLVAASTHEGEEALFLDAAAEIPESAIIIAPRHPERGDAVEALVRERGLHFARRSKGQVPNTRTRVLLADTMGEMGLWLRLADAVYLAAAMPRVSAGTIRWSRCVSASGRHGAGRVQFRRMMADLEARGLGQGGLGLLPALLTLCRIPHRRRESRCSPGRACRCTHGGDAGGPHALIPEPGLLR